MITTWSSSTVRDNVGRTGDDQLASILDPPRPPHFWHVGKISDGAEDSLADAFGGTRIVSGDIGANALKAVERNLAPDNLHAAYDFLAVGRGSS